MSFEVGNPSFAWVHFHPLCGSISSLLLCRAVVDLDGIKYVMCLAKHLVREQDQWLLLFKKAI